MEHFNKKGMEMWVLVSIILALVVLIVLGISISKGGTFVKGNSGCESIGAICVPTPQDCDGRIVSLTCSGERVCCSGE